MEAPSDQRPEHAGNARVLGASEDRAVTFAGPMWPTISLACKVVVYMGRLRTSPLLEPSRNQLLHGPGHGVRACPEQLPSDSGKLLPQSERPIRKSFWSLICSAKRKPRDLAA
jgi:hypothetical protein